MVCRFCFILVVYLFVVSPLLKKTNVPMIRVFLAAILMMIVAADLFAQSETPASFFLRYNLQPGTYNYQIRLQRHIEGYFEKYLRAFDDELSYKAALTVMNSDTAGHLMIKIAISDVQRMKLPRGNFWRVNYITLPAELEAEITSKGSLKKVTIIKDDSLREESDGLAEQPAEWRKKVAGESGRRIVYWVLPYLYSRDTVLDGMSWLDTTSFNGTSYGERRSDGDGQLYPRNYDVSVNSVDTLSVVGPGQYNNMEAFLVTINSGGHRNAGSEYSILTNNTYYFRRSDALPLSIHKVMSLRGERYLTLDFKLSFLSQLPK